MAEDGQTIDCSDLGDGAEQLAMLKPDEDDCDIVSEEPPFMFRPPLYIQRYRAVLDCLEAVDNSMQDTITSVADLGCAECKFLQRAKHLPFLTTLIGVDIDIDLIKKESNGLKPLATDYLKSRPKDLKLQVLAGDISQYDSRLDGIDAISMIEVVEHLHEGILANVRNLIFGTYKPKLVIITTPNSEFNILFPNFTGMRHWDHKFEWCRNEFQDWCSAICLDYTEYRVRYSGVGKPPADCAHLGHCSQLAIFTRIGHKNREQKPNTLLYEEVLSTTYPGHNMTKEQQINVDLEYTILTAASELQHEAEDLAETYVPIARILNEAPAPLKNKLSDDMIVSHIYALATNRFRLTPDRKSVIVNMERQSDDESEKSWDGWHEDLEFRENEGDVAQADSFEEESWD